MGDNAPFGYVVSVVAAHHQDLIGIASDDYAPLKTTGSLGELPVVRLRREIWGAERTIVMLFPQAAERGARPGNVA